MAEHCTCGALLPEDARFCHKCGKPQYDYPGIEEPVAPLPPPMPPPLPAALGPEISFKNGVAVRISILSAIAATLAGSVLSSLTQTALFSLVALFAGGWISPQWYRRRTGQQLSVRGGARIGWITGIFCFVLFLILLTIMLWSVSNAESIPSFRDSPALKNPAFQELMRILADPGKAVQFIIMLVVIFFAFVTTLPMLGGALGAMMSNKRDAAPRAPL